MECANEGSVVGSAAESRRCLPYTRGYAGQRSFVPGRGRRPRPRGGPCHPRSMRIRVEADRRVTTLHTTVDLIVVDEVTRQPVGRPVLTVAIDIYAVGHRLLSGPQLSFHTAGRGLCRPCSRRRHGLRSVDLTCPGRRLASLAPCTWTVQASSTRLPSPKHLEDFGVALIFRPHRPTAFWRAREAPDQ